MFTVITACYAAQRAHRYLGKTRVEGARHNDKTQQNCKAIAVMADVYVCACIPKRFTHIQTCTPLAAVLNASADRFVRSKVGILLHTMT